MAYYYLENSDAYHNEAHIHEIFSYFQKMLWSSVVRKATQKSILRVRYLLFPLQL